MGDGDFLQREGGIYELKSTNRFGYKRVDERPRLREIKEMQKYEQFS